jgi:8-oxo-dGTP pyrophosphatase MutT (NUDIX family)
MSENIQEINVAMAVICRIDEYLLELRSAGNNNGAIGLIGCFGGIIETGEQANVAVAREIKEELGVAFKPEDYKAIGAVDVESDRDGEEVRIHSEVFEILLPYDFEVKSLKGNLVRMKLGEIDKKRDKLTPATRAAFEQFYLEKE